MKNTRHLLFLFVLLFSCEATPDENRTLCENAENHIYQCVEYIPAFTCTDELAEKILNTPCENIKSLWR